MSLGILLYLSTAEDCTEIFGGLLTPSPVFPLPGTKQSSVFGNGRKKGRDGGKTERQAGRKEGLHFRLKCDQMGFSQEFR